MMTATRHQYVCRCGALLVFYAQVIATDVEYLCWDCFKAEREWREVQAAATRHKSALPDDKHGTGEKE